MKKAFTILVIIFELFGLAYGQDAQDKQKFERFVDSAIKRLPPAAFPQLPKAIVRSLDAHGCTVPQTYSDPSPHNVIKGEFRSRGQKDWAVLCSISGMSSIWIFWRGSANAISKIAGETDLTYLQDVDGHGTPGFSRSIEVVGKDYIIEHYKAYNGLKPPPINHQGIDDGHLEKASTVRYYYRGKWLELHGAD